MMTFRTLKEARAFFNELHTNHELPIGEFYNMKTFDVAIWSEAGVTYKKVIAHSSGNFFIIGGGTFHEEGQLIEGYLELDIRLQNKLCQAIDKGFMPYAVLAAIYEYRSIDCTLSLREMFPNIMEQFDVMMGYLV